MTQKETITKLRNEVDRLGDIITDLQKQNFEIALKLHDLEYLHDAEYRKTFDETVDDLPF